MAPGSVVWAKMFGVLASLGDLVDDVVVRLDGPIRFASDTSSRIEHRRGGSSANVAAAAARLGSAARFLGQVGGDSIGRALVAELAQVGVGASVDVGFVRFGGVTGSIVVLVDDSGERSMLTDRASCVDLDDPDPAWLDGVTTLHVPLYSFSSGSLASTADTLIRWAHERSIAVSIDLSSSAVIESIGRDGTLAMIERLRPDVVFANHDEAGAADVTESHGVGLLVVKNGAEPAVIHGAGVEPVEVPAIRLAHGVDTTGAGDAFAAGFLTVGSARPAGPPGVSGRRRARWFDDPVAACRAGHAAAASVLAGR